MRFFILLLSIMIVACNKKQVDIPHGTSTHYSKDVTVGSSSAQFSFNGIDINPNPVQKGTVAKVTANATGKNLTYKWSTPHGDIFGNGAVVYYSDSCVGTYEIICTVSDGTNSKMLSVSITVTD